MMGRKMKLWLSGDGVADVCRGNAMKRSNALILRYKTYGSAAGKSGGEAGAFFSPTATAC